MAHALADNMPLIEKLLVPPRKHEKKGANWVMPFLSTFLFSVQCKVYSCGDGSHHTALKERLEYSRDQGPSGCEKNWERNIRWNTKMVDHVDGPLAPKKDNFLVWKQLHPLTLSLVIIRLAFSWNFHFPPTFYEALIMKHLCTSEN